MIVYFAVVFLPAEPRRNIPIINKEIDKMLVWENVLFRIKTENTNVKIALLTPTCVEAIDISAFFIDV